MTPSDKEEAYTHHQIINALDTLSSAERILDSPKTLLKQSEISQEDVLKDKAAHLQELQKSVEILKEDIVVSPCSLPKSVLLIRHPQSHAASPPNALLSMVRFFRGCMIMALMHAHFDKLLVRCVVRGALKQKRRRAKLPTQGWKAEIDELDDLLDYMREACPESM